MPYILSKLSSDVNYAVYKDVPGGKKEVAKIINVKGKASVTDPRTLLMPNGVATKVTDEELKLLEANPIFKRHKANGHVSISKTESKHEATEAAEEAKDLQADASRQQTEADFKKAKKKAPKTTK